MRKSAFLLISLVFGTVAMVVANQYLGAQTDGSGQLQTTEIFVAAAAIDIGEEITAEKVRLEQWPADRVPEGSSGNFEDLEKHYAKQRFYAGEPIMPVKLMDENWTTVPKNYSVVAMKASGVSIANLIQPGDRVDVLAYFEKSELIPQSMLKTVLLGVRVYALDGDTERRAGEDRPKRIQNIQLLIHKKDQQAWAYAGELGKIQLALGSDDTEYSTEDGGNEAATEFLTWLEDFREAQAKAAEEAKQREIEKRNARKPAPPAAKPSRPKGLDENGFEMTKFSGGRMETWWIVPGKLPVKIGEVDENGTVTSGPNAPGSQGTADDAPVLEADDFGYLNGDDSPLYESSGPADGSAQRPRSTPGGSGPR